MLKSSKFLSTANGGRSLNNSIPSTTDVIPFSKKNPNIKDPLSSQICDVIPYIHNGVTVV